MRERLDDARLKTRRWDLAARFLVPKPLSETESRQPDSCTSWLTGISPSAPAFEQSDGRRRPASETGGLTNFAR